MKNIAGLFLMFSGLCAFLWHFNTVVLAYKIHGALIALLAFFTPAISEVYFFFSVGLAKNFHTTMHIAAYATIGFLILGLFLSFINNED